MKKTEKRKKVFKKILGVIIALTVLFTTLPIQAAEPDLYVPSKTTITIYPSKDTNMRGINKNKQYLCSVPKKATSLKTTNKTVVVLKQEAGYTIYLIPKKAGTATVSFKYNGKTYKTQVSVKKYVNPITSVKIGSITIAGSKFKSSSNLTLNYAKFANKKVKTTVKLAKGWKLNYGLDYLQNSWMRSEMVKNGGVIPVKGGKGFQIIFSATNTKTGQEETFYLIFK